MIFKKLVISLLFILVSGVGYAAQTYSVKDGETVSVTISRNELTRLASNVPLKSVRAKNSYVTVKSDSEKGEAFIMPRVGAPASFSLFVSDINGNTYTIVVTTQDIPSQTIELVNASAIKSSNLSRAYKGAVYPQKIKTLTKAMIRNEQLEDYRFEKMAIDVPLWKETKISLVGRYTGVEFVGEVYLIRNVTDQEIDFNESEFTGFGKNVRSISMMNLNVAPKASTLLYIVRDLDNQ